MKNAIIYTRVSTSSQSKNGESLQVQEQSCRDFCKRNDYQVLAVFSEQFTGTKESRPKIEEALEFIQNSELKIEHIVVLKIDRVSRGGIEIHNGFKRKFEELGVTLKDVHGIIGTNKNVLDISGVNTEKYSWANTNESQYAENISVMMAQDERNKILQRMIGQSIRNNQRGYKVRNADYGFRNEKVITDNGKKTIQVENSKEASYIKRIFELKARGDLNDKDITDTINDMGYTSRTRSKWNDEKTKVIGTVGGLQLDPEQLQRYIRNPIYAGIVKEEWTGNKPIIAPYNGLVSIELWNKANRGIQKIVFDSEKNIDIKYFNGETQIEAPIIKKPKNYNPEYMYSKVLLCPECGGHLTAEKARSKSGAYHYYYQCRGKKGVKHKNYSLRRDETNKEILLTFQEAKFNVELLKLFEEISKKVFEERNEEQKEKTGHIQKSIDNLKGKEKFIIESTDKLISYPELLERKYEELKEVKIQIKQREGELRKQSQTLGLERFKKCSKKILEHPEILASQKENPEIIQLSFELLFGGKIVYEEIKSRTPIKEELLALNTKKEPQVNGSSFDNRKWGGIRGSNPGPCP